MKRLFKAVLGGIALVFAVGASAGLVTLSDPQWPPTGSTGLEAVQFNVSNNDGYMVALGAHPYKNGATMPNDGVSTFYATTGIYGAEDRANWSFDSVVDASKCLTAPCFAVLLMDWDPGAGQDWKSFGSQAASGIVKDSWNMEMNFLETAFGAFDPDAFGKYDFRLSLFGANENLLAQTDISVIVGDGPSQVPEPGSAALFMGGLMASGMAFRRRMKNQGLDADLKEVLET